jgi:hypothetical protein
VLQREDRSSLSKLLFVFWNSIGFSLLLPFTFKIENDRIVMLFPAEKYSIGII